MNIKRLAPVLAALTLALTACDDSKKGSDVYGGPDSGGNLPGDSVNMNGGGGSGGGGGADSNGIPAADRPAGINPDTDVDYQTLSSSTVYFDFDHSTVRADQRGKLEAVKQWLDANPGRSLFLAGHADKRGTPEYNRALGERRSLAVREYLAGLGLPPDHLYTNSYGSDRPADTGDSEDAYAKNRRVEIGVINQK